MSDETPVMSDETFAAERPRNPFNSGQEVVTRPLATLGALASAEQQRVLGELQAEIMLARLNPRDPQAAVDAILRDCSRVTLAAVSQYEYARGGTEITGPSIKLMEAIARRWGNVRSGFKVIHSENGVSEVLTYAFDVETGYRDERQFPVRHVRDTRNGPVPVVDERDVYELIANMAQRRKRSCLQAIIPADVIDAAREQCTETMNANVDISVEGLKKLLAAFSEFNVTQKQIEQRIQSRLEAISPGQVMQLSRIYTSLKDGMSQPSQWFRAADPEPPPQRQTQQKPAARGAARTAQAASKAAAAPTTAPATKAAQEAPKPTQEAPKAEAAQETVEAEEPAAFSYPLIGDYGEVGPMFNDPFEFAKAFMAALEISKDPDNVTLENGEAILEAARLDEHADALLDAVIHQERHASAEQAEPEAEPEPEPEVIPPEEDKDSRACRAITETIEGLTTIEAVNTYAQSLAVQVPARRWERDGRTDLVEALKAAFAKQRAELSNV
jgi:hypothetical protein